MKRRYKIALLVLLSMFAGIIYARIEARYWTEIAHETFVSDYWHSDTPLRIAHLTDIHYDYMSATHWNDIVDMILTEKVDFVVMTGDYYTNNPTSDTPLFVQGLQRLTQSTPVFAVWGNHDRESFQKGKKLPDGLTRLEYVRIILEEGGVKILENQEVTTSFQGDSVRILGMDDLTFGNREKAWQLLQKENNDSIFTLALQHNCCYIEHLISFPSFQVILMGHTHGGQIQIPILKSPAERLWQIEYVKGRRDYPSQQMAYITRGVGSILGIRFMCRPEILILEVAKPCPKATTPSADND